MKLKNMHVKIQNAKDSFWSFCQGINSDIKRGDPNTWSSRWPAHPGNGIFSSFGFNHSQFCWQTRCLAAVKKAFASIWGTNDLLVSFDAGNVFRPWKVNPLWLTDSNWWHVDQNSIIGPERQGRVCVQGFVTYYDATEVTGGLCVIPGSHKYHSEVCARADSAKFKMDYVSIRPSDPLLQENDGVLVLAKAGDLILWDSRTVHCNTHALNPSPPAHSTSTLAEHATHEDNKDIIRLVSYVCMLPRSLATQKVIESRKAAFLSRTPTSHWPTKEVTSYASTRGHQVNLRECPKDMLYLVGYTDEEIAAAHTEWQCSIQ